MALDLSKLTGIVKNVKDKLEDSGIDSLDDIKGLLEGDGLKDIIADVATDIQGSDPDSAVGKSVVKKIADFISEKFTKCSPDMLKGLGKKLVSGDIKEKLESAAGDGAANWVKSAIDKWADKV